MKKVDLPRKYEYKEGESLPKYKKYNGWNKISYSQYTSFNADEDPLYRIDYLARYILGLDTESGIFAYFGSACGDYVNIQDQRIDGYLDDSDKKVLDGIIEGHPHGSEFEYEVLINLEPFGLEKTVLQGFTDRQYKREDGRLNINDYKTLNIAKKGDFYASNEYKQLQVYGYGLEELGFEIGDTWVTGLGRKGNVLDKQDPNPNKRIRLSGEVKIIPNLYDRRKAEGALKDIAKTCLKISDYKKTYERYFN